MIYEYFRATGAYEAVQGLSTLFARSLQNDDVQDFDVRWDEALLSASEIPTEMILEGLYKSKLQNSVQLLTVLALYDQETVRNNGQPSYSRLKTSVKLHIDQMMRTRNFRARNEVVERGSVTKSQKQRKPSLRGKRKSVFSGRHMDNVPEETHVVSVMSKSRWKQAQRSETKKDDRLLLHPTRRRKRLTARNKNPHRDQAVNRKTR